MSPSQEVFLGQARWRIAAMRVSVAFLRLGLVLRGYNPDQPRVRASRLPLPVATFGLRRHGSFESAESANDLVNRTLEQNAPEVDRVASGRARDAFITSRFGYRTGREAYTAGRLDPYMRNTYGVGVFIVRDPASRNGYRVKTAYPRNDGD